MKACYCDREAAVFEAVKSGRWPQACDSELRAHALHCSICADVVLVAQIVQQENVWARAEVALPAAGLVWWKAQMRARREAAVRAAEPIAIVESVAAIFVIISLVGLGIWRRDWVASWIAWLADLPHSDAFHPHSLLAPEVITSYQSFSYLILLSLGAGLLLASLVLYLLFTEES
jgi:hypothetical protein